MVANPVPESEQLDGDLHDRALAADRGIAGRDLTPLLLAHLHDVTGGRSLHVDIALVEHNVMLAARIARAVARHGSAAPVT